MSTGATAKPPPSRPRKDRERDREKKDKASQPAGATERLKTVVRRLPPNLPEDVFWQSVQNWVTDDTATWKVFYPGKFRKRLNKENIPSRAYIAFKNEEHLALFSREYDGHLFRDKAGNESQAVVEFAPYQKTPAEKKKADARNATVDHDEDYISFLESLKAAAANPEPVSLETLIAATQPPAPPKTTPLLEALKAEKSVHKDKEAILRNHAHYKDQPAGPSTSKKDDSKKKGGAAQKLVESAQTPGPGGKKAAKKAASVSAQNQPAGAPSKNGPTTSTSKPVKPSKSARQGKTSASTMTPVASGSGSGTSLTIQPNQIQVDDKILTSAVTTTTTSGTVLSVTPAIPVTSRRTRPVIGLASRQFEAALNGAGVGTERKSRRERDKDKDGGATRDKDKGMSLPRKERGGKRRESGGGPGVAVFGGTPQAKIPSILQRTDGAPPTILQRETPRIFTQVGDGETSGTGVSASPAGAPLPAVGMAADVVTANPDAGAGGGRGRRGRGRGRGGRVRGG